MKKVNISNKNLYRVGRDYLRSIRVLDLQIKRLQAKRHALEMSLYPSGIRYDLDKVQTSPHDRQADVSSEICDIDNEIKTWMESRIQKIHKISALIEYLEDEEEKTVLTLYFIDHVSVEGISLDLDYSEQGIYTIIRRGCIKIANRLLESEGK